VRPAPLDRKVLRDLWRMKWQVLAIALLIACGVAVAVMSFSAQGALARAQAQYYAETRFADVFAQAKRAPLSITSQLSAIDSVTVIDVRIVGAGLMDVPGLARPACIFSLSGCSHPSKGGGSVGIGRFGGDIATELLNLRLCPILGRPRLRGISAFHGGVEPLFGAV